MKSSTAYSRESRSSRYRKLHYLKSFVGAVLLSVWMMPALAEGTAAGTTIDNTAYGSFENPADNSGTPIPVQSNTVRLTIAEVAGISVTNQGVTEAPSGVPSAGPAQGDSVIGSEDVLYFTYRITNIGNDQTQFFIPDTPASVENATFDAATIGPIKIIGYSGSATPLDIDVTAGAATGTITGMPNGGSIPVDGYIDVQIPVKASAGLVPGTDEITVVLGNTVSQDAADQNVELQPDGAFGTGNNVNTVDNTGTDNGDFDGSPAFEREASSSQITAVGEANLDYGDAPDTAPGTATGTATADYESAPGRGPSHVVGSIYLGSEVDAETTFSEDDGPPLEDDGVVVVGTGTSSSLHTQSFIAGQSYQLDVTTVGAGKLSAWIDFNRDGDFDDAGEQVAVDVDSTGATESITVNVPIGADAGSTYARFRYSTATGLTSTNAAPDGEVEDYQITLIAADPAMKLVKRITRIADAGAAPTEGVITDVNDDLNDTDDDAPNWPTGYLQGSFENSTVEPNQEVDYTIYFLSDGNTPINNVRICDLVPDNTTYVPGSLQISQGGAAATALTDINGDDAGEFFDNTATLNAPCTGTNSDGGVYITVPGTLDNATAPGAPTSSYGFIRFSVTVD